MQALATIFKNCVFLLLKQLITQTHLLQAYSFRSPACFMCCDTYHSCGCSRCFCRCFAMTTMKMTTANARNCSFNPSCVANTLLKIGKVICVKHVAPHITKWLGLWMNYVLLEYCDSTTLPHDARLLTSRTCSSLQCTAHLLHFREMEVCSHTADAKDLVNISGDTTAD